MSMSVNNAINMSMAMQDQQTDDQIQALMLRKTLDSNEQVIAGLLDSIGDIPQASAELATSGTVGTQVNTTA